MLTQGGDDSDLIIPPTCLKARIIVKGNVGEVDVDDYVVMPNGPIEELLCRRVNTRDVIEFLKEGSSLNVPIGGSDYYNGQALN